MCIKSVCSELLDIPESQIAKADFLLDPKTPWVYFMDESWRILGDRNLLEQFLDSNEMNVRISTGFSFDRKVHIIHFLFAWVIHGILEVHSHISPEDRKSKSYLRDVPKEKMWRC